ncbi:hypothetical protein GSI_08653 [Ganoderma sinense ZZ0214-1]|uniref:Uncharacterized protein n=1 Tax=Ganoderma sinense ZZ0214-1 TaxID=1077348 RepID=A0A2G8S4C2_9APHY|nr:hypothetical protein GSI_08653 [Ganoderma sinense ZZ0214-1]
MYTARSSMCSARRALVSAESGNSSTGKQFQFTSQPAMPSTRRNSDGDRGKGAGGKGGVLTVLGRVRVSPPIARRLLQHTRPSRHPGTPFACIRPLSETTARVVAGPGHTAGCARRG